MKVPQDGEEMIKMTDAEKLALIAKITAIQIRHQNDEDGDRHLSDAYLAVEAIDAVLAGDRGVDAMRGNGALRMYLEAAP